MVGGSLCRGSEPPKTLGAHFIKGWLIMEALLDFVGVAIQTSGSGPKTLCLGKKFLVSSLRSQRDPPEFRLNHNGLG